MATGEISFDNLMTATARFRAAVEGTDPKFIKAPAVWINKGSYLDESPSAATGAIEGQTVNPRTFSDDKWRAHLKLWTEKQQWSSSYWGPKPGEPGCLVPSHLILSPVLISQGAA